MSYTNVITGGLTPREHLRVHGSLQEAQLEMLLDHFEAKPQLPDVVPTLRRLVRKMDNDSINMVELSRELEEIIRELEKI